ncbi:adenylate/guanylate cyclase domain-containing protein [Cellulomonas sp. ATA003]|uniref:adenylate/guanylate cyclase domain-containing protein n=1 Tax=Cellulomonas sp. ATA003 TaxID=3073064 RepID=UPI002873E832|nr:adenylate/guanylate cyclase domain-containing protein [Cellulomonas sp. ATA003]WNB85772.1 adenylate/guanylate cyclase domain-containing protein [Cellulomonas sp. ATA003]
MGWTEQASLERARDTYEATVDVSVSTVARKTDFESISLTNPRRVRGAHLYLDVTNFTDLLGQPEEGTDEDMLRLVHLYAREVTRVVEADLDAVKVHFQGPRLHAVAYRPISDDAEMVAKAVVAAAAIQHTATIFNEVFRLSGDLAWKTAAGIAFGDVIATRNGTGGDRELLFLGAPANYAAKMISAGVRISADAADLLPDDVRAYVSETNDDVVCKVSMTADQVEALCEHYGWTWSADQTRKRPDEAAEKYPPGCATVKKPTVTIDKSALGLSNSKRLHAVSIFADVDGFTKYIDEATEQDEDLIEAVRAFHTLRKEMRSTAVIDYDSLRIQYQGDRMQAIAYLPFDDEAKAALTAVKVAAALQSVATNVMPQVVDASAAKPLAIGVAAGSILLSKLGEHGDRDVVALGPAVAEAARIQQRLDGTVTGINKAVYDSLPAWLQQYYVYSGGAYVAHDLTLDVIEREEKAAEKSEEAKAARTSPAYVGSTRPAPDAPLRPWAR